MLRVLASFWLLFSSPPPDLNRGVRYWQHRLNLDEWQISVKAVSAQELHVGTAGDVEWDPQARTAVIRVLRERDYDLPPRRARADQQLTLAHEMVHLVRFVRMGERGSADEVATCHETGVLLRTYHRWRELSAVEDP